MPDDMKQLVAITALNKMMKRGHFDICTIDSVARMLGVDPKGPAYTTLHPLHCVDFSEMPRQLREAIPGLVNQCLGSAAIFEFRTLEAIPIPVEPEEPGKPRAKGILGMLGVN